MRVTVDIVENGYVVAPAPAIQGERPRVFVAKNTLDLAEVFAGLQREDELLEGRGPDGEYSGLLSSMRGAGLAIVKGEGRKEEGEEPDGWDPIDVMERTVARANAAAQELEQSGEWPSTLPGSDASTSADVPVAEPAPPAEEPVSYEPAAEDGYEFPAVRGPLNGRREIQCPTHGWQTAAVRDGAYRCQFKPSPRQVCQEPGTPKDEAEKRLVAS